MLVFADSSGPLEEAKRQLVAINSIPAGENDISALPQLSHLLNIVQRKVTQQQQQKKKKTSTNKLIWEVHVLPQKQQEKWRQGIARN